MNPTRILIACALIACCHLHPATLSAQTEVRFDHLTVDDGLSDSFVSDIHQDRDGYLWFATRAGLCRYDGYGFAYLEHHPEDSASLSGNWVDKIQEDPRGDLWIFLSVGGIEHLSRETGRLTYYHEQRGKRPGLSSDFLSVARSVGDAMWVGTVAGLNQVVSGSDVPRIVDHPTLSEAMIRALCGVGDELWVGTDRGTFRIDAAGEIHRVDLPGGGSGIAFIHARAGGEVWIASLTGEFFVGDRDTEFVLARDAAKQLRTRFFLLPDPVPDGDEALWCLPSQGRPFRFLFEERVAEDPLTDHPDGHTIGASGLVEILLDRNRHLWMASRARGLFRYRIADHEVDHFLHRPDRSTSLAGNSVTSLLEDRGGLIWAGCEGRGVSYVDPRKQQFTVARPDPRDPNGLPASAISAVAFGPREELWVGTRFHGLFCLSPDAERVLKRIPESRSRFGLTNRSVTSIHVDRERRLWVGTTSGLNRADLASFDPTRDEDLRFRRYYCNPVDDKTLCANLVHSLTESETGAMWIGHGNPGAVSRLDPETHEVRRFLPGAQNQGLNGSPIWTILEEPPDTLWLGSPGAGLTRFNVETGALKTFLWDPNDPTTLNNRSITSLLLDSRSRLWVGTFSGGLNLFDRETESFTHFTKKTVLPSNLVHGMVEGIDGNLWLATNRGLCAFDPETSFVTTYTTRDGLQGLEFSSESIVTAKNGKILAGGLRGANVFDPRTLQRNRTPPLVVLTSLRQGTTELLRWGLPTPEFEFTHRENDLSFEFAALDFANPAENRYRYRLLGLKKEWVEAGARRAASYVNLPPGEYEFQVQGSNSDGIWNLAGASVPLSILPPFWQWTSFRIGAGTLALLLLLGLYRWRVRKIEKQNRVLETKVAEKTSELRTKNERLRRLDEDKSEFVRVAAHDMRTPLTSLNAYLGLTVESLQDGTFDTETVIDDLQEAQGCAARVTRLLSSMLDIAAIEDGRLGLDLAPGSLEDLVRERSRFFRRVAEQKKLDFASQHGSSETLVAMDRERMGEVLDNLISNAIKFTYPGGRIRVLTRTDAGRVRVSVNDTGQGLDDEDLRRVFGRFQRLSARPTAGEGSIGLGLAIVKKIVELHGGEVTVESRKGEGSTFTFALPTLEGPTEFPRTPQMA